jgi:outer membrane protein TolC
LYAAPLALDDAIELLKTQNLEIKTAALDAQSAQRDLKTAQGYSYGSLDFTQTASRSNDALTVFGSKLTSREVEAADFGIKYLNYPAYQNYYQSKLTYTLPLYTGGKLSGYEKIAHEMEAIKQLDTQSVTAEKIYQTRKSYYDMALISDSMSQINLILTNLTTLEKSVTAMIREGYAKKVDLLEVQAKKANVGRMIQEMANNQQLIYHYLSFLLNQEVTQITLPNLQELQTNIHEADVIASNLEVKKASKAVEMREHMIDVANAAYLPQIGLFGEAATADTALMGNFGDHKAYTLGARLSWNIFNGGIDHQSLEKARLEHLKSKTQTQLAQKGISLQYNQIHTQIDNDDAQIQSLTQELALAQEIYRNYEGRYRENLVSMNDVLIKQSGQIEKIVALQTVKNQRNERIFALEKLISGAKQ